MVPKLVISGGPCGGKTSGMAYISQKLLERGFYPLVVPEAATFLMKKNLSPRTLGAHVFQSHVVKTTIEFEDKFMRKAQKRLDRNPVLLCDRGLANCATYVPEDIYCAVLREHGIMSHVAARDERYRAVFHLVTAAQGAEKFYTLENNDTRHETPEEARILDERTLAAWIGHPHLRVIDNSTDFDGKLIRLDQEICVALGIPVPIEIERKFLCAPVDPATLPPGAQHIEIEQVYLISEPGVITRVRKRGQHGAFTYYRTEKRFLSSGVNAETERLITATEYEASMRFCNPRKRPLHKTRICFVFENQYFELDVIPRPDGKTLYIVVCFV